MRVDFLDLKTAFATRGLRATLWSALALTCWLAPPARAEVGASCTSDASCAADESCQVTGASGSGGCSSSGVCEPDRVVEHKTCVARVRTCSTDADCPDPSVCLEAADGSVSSDGKTETRTPSTRVCTWKPRACQTDSECGDARYGCLEVAREQTCSGGSDDGDAPEPAPRGGAGGSSTGTATPGTSMTAPAAGPFVPKDDPTPEERPAPEAPSTCTTTRVLKACMPKPVACTTHAQCSGGWSCVDAAKLDEPYTHTSTGYCMPEGVKLATTGHVALDGSAFAGEARDGGDEAGVPRGSKGSNGSTSAPPTADDTSAKSDGGCSFGGHAGGGASLSMLAILAALVRRRTRRQP